MPTLRTRIGAAALAMAAVPALAAAAQVVVQHGRGPTVVHDTAYADSRAQVHSWSRDGRTEVRLVVSGLPAGRTFGAHVHTAACGADPLASGGHYQHSTDTSVELADRELWLDVTTDANGRGTTTTTVPWTFAPGTAGSVVIHAAPTNPATGAAGARLTCTTVPFGEHEGHGRH